MSKIRPSNEKYGSNQGKFIQPNNLNNQKKISSKNVINNQKNTALKKVSSTDKKADESKKSKDSKPINEPSQINNRINRKSSSLISNDLNKGKDNEKEENDKEKENIIEKDKENKDINKDSNKNDIKHDNNNNSNNNKDNVYINQNPNNSRELYPTREPSPKGGSNEEEKKKEEKYEFYINNYKRNVEEKGFKCNRITTTKYNIFTFLPKALLFQFARIANIYFVAIAVIQCIPAISPLGPSTAIAPIIIVFSVSLIRELIEDLHRRDFDKKQNSDMIDTLRDGNIIKVQCGDLQMGELVKVYKDDTFPADLLLLDSNLPDGSCFIETGTLDGEKNLKLKESPIFTRGRFNNNSQNDKTPHTNSFKEGSKKQINQDSNPEENTINKENDNKKKAPVKKKRTQNIPPQQSGFSLSDDSKLKKLKSGDSSNDINNDIDNDNHDMIDNDNNNNINNVNQNNKENEIDFDIEGKIQCDKPNYELYVLNGSANIIFKKENDKDEKIFGLDKKYLLLKGAKLKNTEWIIGIIIYTGHNCKIMQNAKEPRLKMSSIEKLLNKLLIIIFICQVILSIISAILHNKYYGDHKNIIIQSKVLEPEERIYNYWIDYLLFNLGADSLLTFFTYLLLLNTLIPISLIITLELVKIVQGMFMVWDVGTFALSKGKGEKGKMKTNSVCLNEELGSVDYIFSDKTGTLTANKMNLKFCVIGKQCYEFIHKKEELPVNEKLREEQNIWPFYDYTMIKSSSLKIKDNIDENDKLPLIKYKDFKIKNKDINFSFETSQNIIEEYWKLLSICHDCSIQDGEYVGTSPDNLELVKSAKAQGFVFEPSQNNSKIILSYTTSKDSIDTEKKNQFVFEKLYHIEFSSDRKRESMLVKEGNLYKLYIKGADTIIAKRLDNSTPPEVLETCRKFVDCFSEHGYRTLFVAMRILTEKQTQDFLKGEQTAQLENDAKIKKQKLDNIYDTIENSLTLIGATIVEDKLQDSVPEVITELRQAGIKIWMLTGDKLSTAYNIGLSCGLIDTDSKDSDLDGLDKEELYKQRFKTFILEGKEGLNKEGQEKVIMDFCKEHNKYVETFGGGISDEKKMKFGVLVNEVALKTIIDNDKIKELFLSRAKNSVAVICCRVAPKQKGQVVEMMKNFDKTKITLAIGDGGNDVNMIMEAHIGIGINGEEGPRAAQSSDYAIGEFKVLKRLLFFHGYLNLMRNSMMIIYFFYKNFVFTIVHFFYGFVSDFSGQTIIDDWFITLYNLLFTSIPLAGRGIIDISLRPEDGQLVDYLMPYLYKEQREYPVFTVFQFVLNLLKGALHSFINYYITLYSVNSNISSDGYESNLWVLSVTLYTNMLLIVTLDLIIFTKYHTYINWLLIIFLTIVLYILFLLIVQRSTMFYSVGTMSVTFNSLIIWMNFILVCGLCSLIDFIVLSFKTFFINSIFHKVELISRKDETRKSYIKSLPKELSEKILAKLPPDKNRLNSVRPNNNGNNNEENSQRRSKIDQKIPIENQNEMQKDETKIEQRITNENQDEILKDSRELDQIKSIKIDNKNCERKKNSKDKNFEDIIYNQNIISNINGYNHNHNHNHNNHNPLISNNKFMSKPSGHIEKTIHRTSIKNNKKQRQTNNMVDKDTKIICNDNSNEINKNNNKKSSQCEYTNRKLLDLDQKI